VGRRSARSTVPLSGRSRPDQSSNFAVVTDGVRSGTARHAFPRSSWQGKRLRRCRCQARRYVSNRRKPGIGRRTSGRHNPIGSAPSGRLLLTVVSKPVITQGFDWRSQDRNESSIDLRKGLPAFGSSLCREVR
jgi:hypothetical protein